MKGQNEYTRGKEELQKDIIRDKIIETLKLSGLRELNLIYQFAKNILGSD